MKFGRFMAARLFANNEYMRSVEAPMQLLRKFKKNYTRKQFKNIQAVFF